MICDPGFSPEKKFFVLLQTAITQIFFFVSIHELWLSTTLCYALKIDSFNTVWGTDLGQAFSFPHKTMKFRKNSLRARNGQWGEIDLEDKKFWSLKFLLKMSILPVKKKYCHR